MRNKKSNWINLIVTLPLLFSIFMSPVYTAAAQDTRPEKPFQPEQPHEQFQGQPYQADDGSWYLSDSPLSAAGTEVRGVRDVGGPDDFGYTWDDTELFSWIDAKTSGTNINLYGGDVYTTEPVNIGFSFPFYGSQYEDLFITTKGLVSFLNGGYWYDSRPIPTESEPNNFIGVLWSDLGMYPVNRPDAGIYVFQGGEAPKRFFVIEWHRADVWSGEGNTGLGRFDLTFQIILHEDGDIVMQYHTVNLYPNLYSIGIEDPLGLDGLQYLHSAPGLSNGLAIKYSYPPASTRVSLTPRYQGSFIGIGESETFEIILRNNGDLGADSYDLTTNSSWSISLFEQDGVTPIIIPIALGQGEQKTILATVTAPPTAQKGDEDQITITATSVGDVTKSRTSSIDAAIPAPFAQTYSNDDEGSVQTQLNWPDTQRNVPVTPDWEYPDSPAIVETPGHNFVHVWREWVFQSDQRYGNVLKFAVMDQLGQVVQPTTALSSVFTGGTGYHYTDDRNHAIAVAPDGKVGVIWTRMIYRGSDDNYNYNVWFAVLNPAGSITYGPVQITNNTTFSNYTSGYNIFGNTRIAASEDNRFMLTWTRTYQSSSSTNASILTMVRTSGGAPVTGINNITGSVNNIQFGNLILTALTGNRHFLTYWRLQPMEYGYLINAKYRVFNSVGVQLVTEQPYTHHPFIEDSIQTATGDIFLANYYFDFDTWAETVGFIILDGDNYTLKHESSPGLLAHPSVVDYDSNSLSVTKDQDGNAIMTWRDRGRKNLYYALIAPDGTVLSGPSLIVANEHFSINTNGYAITTNTWSPSPGVDVMSEFSSSVFRALPGESAQVKVSFANLGVTKATGVQLTITLNEELTFIDTTYNNHLYMNHMVTFEIPDLNFGDGDDIMVYLGIPSDAELGTFYDLSLEITCDEADVDLSNNSDTAQITTSVMNYLPLILR